MRQSLRIQDQIKVILRGLGAQTDADLSFLTSDHAITYVKELTVFLSDKKTTTDNDSRPQQLLSKTCQEMTWGINTKTRELLTILMNCLSLNPYFRMTAVECLKMSVFDTVRDKTKEKVLNLLKSKRGVYHYRSPEQCSRRPPSYYFLRISRIPLGIRHRRKYAHTHTQRTKRRSPQQKW